MTVEIIQMQPFQIVSLWAMLQFSPETMSALGFVSGCHGEWRMLAQFLANPARRSIAPVEISLEKRAQFLKSCQTLADAARRHGLPATEAAANRAFDQCMDLLAAPIGHDGHRLARIVALTEQLVQVFGDEFRGQYLVSLPARHRHFFLASAVFGEGVENSFPGASFDIAEAGKCRALGRWTACVMHVMRVLELGLSVLARHYDVSADGNWNQTLNLIEARTREVGKRTHGVEAEQWAAEAATHLRFVKNAWRNHAMHPMEKYDEERAVAIFDSSRAFMQHLAEKLSEDDGGRVL